MKLEKSCEDDWISGSRLGERRARTGAKAGRWLLWKGRMCCFEWVWDEEQGGNLDSC